MIVKRVMLVTLHQEWDIDPDDLAGMEPDTPEYDDAVCAHGALVVEDVYFDVENDGLVTLPA